MNSPLFISVQGNIGSGKSTLVKLLQKYFNNCGDTPAGHPLTRVVGGEAPYPHTPEVIGGCASYNDLRQLNVCFLQEPVDVWETIKDKEGKSMVELFYSNQEKYSFAFQMMAYISRLAIIKQALKENYDIIISERSLNTDKNVFAKMLYDSGKIEDVEYQIYLKWFEEFQKDIPEEHIIYIETTPDTAFHRVNKRSRKGENIPFEYLKKCCEYHNDWLYTETYEKMLVIDGNKDTDKTPEVILEWIHTITEWIRVIQTI